MSENSGSWYSILFVFKYLCHTLRICRRVLIFSREITFIEFDFIVLTFVYPCFDILAINIAIFYMCMQNIYTVIIKIEI